MYLGFSQLNAPKPALLLGVSEKCASKVSKSGLANLFIAQRHLSRPAPIDTVAIRELERFDGKFVVHSNDDTLTAEDMALVYKQLQRVEESWRTMKSGLRMRPVFHWAPHRIHGAYRHLGNGAATGAHRRARVPRYLAQHP